MSLSHLIARSTAWWTTLITRNSGRHYEESSGRCPKRRRCKSESLKVRLMSTEQGFQGQGWWMVGGGVAVVAGVFGPWSRAPGALQLQHSWAGISTWHGRGTLVLGILLI